MKTTRCLSVILCSVFAAGLTGCVHNTNSSGTTASLNMDYSSRIPQNIQTAEKTIVVYPNVHTWGAYNANGELVRSGNASAGADWCNDIHRPCRTHVGTHRIQSLGGPECISHTFPVGRGGAPMPYCMFFSGGQALHGVPPFELGEGNYSHGCVRMHVSDAEWLRYDFAGIGTKVIVKPY